VITALLFGVKSRASYTPARSLCRPERLGCDSSFILASRKQQKFPKISKEFKTIQ